MRKPLLLLIVLLFPILVFAQIESPGRPWSQDLKLKSLSTGVTFPGLSAKAEAAYISTFSPELKGMVFAFPFETFLSADQHGEWKTLANGSKIWRLALSSPQALSLNLIFSRFRLPPGASLFLYTPDYQTIHGAFTDKNQSESGVLATVPLPGDRIIVELNLPANPQFIPILEISKVSHDFKGFFKAGLNQTYSGGCNIDINCPAGDDWQTEKKSVVKFIRGGNLLCSGALINNTRNDGRPLLLSANHTIGSESQAVQTVFFFQFERPSCGSGSGSTQHTLSGSKLLATTNKLDFSLVELSTVPPQEYEPVYAGWDNRVFAYLDTVTCIHHPSGDVKKISKSYQRVVTGDFGGGYDSNTHWHISAWDLGTTEGGSSGSPLFNNDHRIIGDLTGGDASCSYNFHDYYQKLSVSWDKYPDSSQQLKHWLDPIQSGVSVLSAFDPYSGGRPVANFSIRPDRIEVGRKAYFSDLSTGLPTSWTWSFDNGIPAGSSLQTPAAVKFLVPGTYHITLWISNTLGIDSVQQTITVFDSPSNSISETRIVPGRQVKLTDHSLSIPLSVQWTSTGASPPVNSGSVSEISFAIPGEYSVSEIIEFNDFTDTLIHFNQIKVIPEVLAYQSFSFRNVKPDEHTSYIKMGSQGYLPGSNNLGITGYAEAFRKPSDTTLMIYGVTIPLEMVSKWSVNYYLPIMIWNANKQVVLKDSILISGLQPNSRLTKWLRTPVNFDTLIYVGFQARPWEQGTFVAKMATDRGEKAQNTAFALKGTNWLPMSDVAGIHTAFDFGIETAALMNSYKEEIQIVPNYNDGNFTLDLGVIIFDKVEISIYNIKGQKVTADVVKTDNQISFQITPPVPGVYVVRLLIDNYQFATKVMIIGR